MFSSHAKANFKFQFTLVFSLILFFLTACDLKTHEVPPPPKMAKFVAGDQVNCLTKTLPYFSAFLEGSSEGKRIDEFWACAASALEVFSEKSVGDLSGGYSAKALVNFLETYFLEDGTRINSDLSLEVMRLKQLFVGGDLASFKKNELKDLIKILGRLKTVSVKLAPYMKVYNGNWEPSVGVLVDNEMQYFEAANQELQNFAKEFSSLIKSDSPNYKIDSFVNLLKAMQPLMGPQFSIIEQADPLASLLKKIKVALAGGQEEDIAANEWRRFLLIGLRGYIQVLRFDYFVSKAESGRTRQIIFLARTIDDIFSMMSDLVSEKPEQTLSRIELAGILDKLSEAYPSFKTSDVLLLELMKVKRIFFGGSINLWTVEEFNRARQKVAVFRDITLRLVPYLQVYDSTWTPVGEEPDEARRYYQEAHRTLRESAQDLGDVIEDSYKLTDFGILTKELASLYPESFASLDESIKSFLPAVVAYKNLIVSDSGEVINPREWSPFLVYSSRFFERYQYANYFLKTYELKGGEGLLNLNEFLNGSVDLIESLAKSKPLEVISFVEIQRILGTLKNLEKLKLDIDIDAINDFLKIAVERFLTDPKARLAGRKPLGIGRPEASQLKLEIQRYVSAQQALWKVLNQDPYANVDAQTAVSRLQAIEQQQGLDATVKAAVTEMRVALSARIPLVIDSKFKLAIRNQKAGYLTYDLGSLTKMNLFRTLTSILIKGYSGQVIASYPESGLSESEFTLLVKELVPILVKAGLIYEYKDTYATARFLEANLFTVRANGDKTFSFVEGVDYLPMVVSGIVIDSEFKKDLADHCATYTFPQTSRPFVDKNCYSNEFLTKLPTTFSHIPGFVSYFGKMSFAGQKEALLIFESGAGFDKAIDGKVKLSDVGLLPNVFQYIEMIMAKYDRTNNGFLDTAEALGAYPVFKEKIKELSGFDKDSMNEAIFTYMLRYGEPPKKTPGGILKLLRWKGNRDEWDVWADRAQLAKILAALQEESDKKPKN